jgi:uncharacterized protein (TIGR04255 family)
MHGRPAEPVWAPNRLGLSRLGSFAKTTVFRRSIGAMTDGREPAGKAERRTLNVPLAPNVEYERNFIRLAVCELRFPTMLEWEDKPVALPRTLRKLYPLFERAVNLNLRVGSAATTDNETIYKYHSRDGAWSVTFRASAVTLETKAYRHFEEFGDRLRAVLNASKSLIDADFFTRVGLRYIDALPVDQDGVAGWVRAELIAPLVSGVFGTVDSFSQDVRGRTDSGGFIFRHGPGFVPDSGEAYVLDMDFFGENIEFSDTMQLVERLHAASYNLFAWSLGAKAIEYMGNATPKGK